MSNKKKKVNKKVILGIVIGAMLLLMNLVLYKVDTTEYAVVTQFGNPVNTILSPGLNMKLPDPVQTVQKFDKRIQVFQANPLEILTLDKKSVVVDYYSTWKIVDPVLYMKTVKDKIGAEARLLDVFSSSLGIQFGKYNLDELVNVEAEKLKLGDMMVDAKVYSQEKAAEYGIEIVDTQVKSLNFPETNKQSVYDRMKAEREQMAQKYRSEGSEEAAKIRADAEKEQTIILSEAYKEAQKLKGEGDAEAIRIYAEAFQKDTDFYEFIRTLETYEKTIDGNTTLILPSTAEILKYLSNGKVYE
ncbi:MAG: protease modulator HflC [Firmicutes bacterium HGW-Firmicutes-5]|nr:MAG: protease modulator HflC [Firmicutes bacterium HGW-Firmicutes-5]